MTFKKPKEHAVFDADSMTSFTGSVGFAGAEPATEGQANQKEREKRSEFFGRSLSAWIEKAHMSLTYEARVASPDAYTYEYQWVATSHTIDGFPVGAARASTPEDAVYQCIYHSTPVSRTAINRPEY